MQVERRDRREEEGRGRGSRQTGREGGVGLQAERVVFFFETARLRRNVSHEAHEDIDYFAASPHAVVPIHIV